MNRNLKRSKMLRRSTIFLLFLVFGVEYAKSNALGNKNVCSTSSCKDAGELLSKNIDQGEDPCNDFHKFACGGYLKSLDIPNGMSRAGHYSLLQQKVFLQLKGLLEEEVDSNEPRIFGMTKNYYKSCVEESAGQKTLEALMKIIKQLGGWPVLEGSAWKEDFDLFETEVKLRKLGYRPNRVVKIYSSLELSNTSRSSLHIGPPDISVDFKHTRNRLLKSPIKNVYYTYMVDMAVLFGAKRETAEEDLKKVYFFEKSLHKVVSSEEVSISGNFRPIELLYNVEHSKYSWLEYINNITEPIVRFDNESEVNVVSLNYLSQLDDVLNNIEKRTLANYMIWKIISEAAMYLPKEYSDRTYEFNKNNSVRKAYPPKQPTWINCLSRVMDNDNGLAVAMSSMYVKRFFRDETRKQVEPIIQYLADAFRETVNKASWTTDSLKATALKKLKIMRSFIAYPDELLNDQKLDEYFRSLEILPDNHFQNLLNLQRFHYESELSNLNRATSEHMWTSFAESFTVEAAYDTQINNFVVRAGILQPPIFNPDWPSYARFGSIGFIVGHQIMHAYNPSVIMNKLPGVPNDWLDDKSKRIYSNGVHCFVDQYNNYTDKQTNMEIDGLSTLKENDADNSGLKIAYRAYRNWVNKYGEDPRPEQLQNYSSDQLFFISSLNYMCEKLTMEEKIDQIVLDAHTPVDIRALGMLSNSEEFARAFNCPVGSNMNTGKRCVIWE